MPPMVSCGNTARAHTNKFGVKGLSLVGKLWRGRLHKDGKTLCFLSNDRAEVESWLAVNRVALHGEFTSYA